MKPTLRKRHWILLTASAAVCASVFAFTRSFQPGRLVGEPALAALQAERETLRPNSDAERAGLQRQWEALRAASLTPAKLDSLRQKLGAGWLWQALPATPGAAFHEAVLSRDHARLGEWPQILATVESLQADPSLRLMGLEIGASGRGDQRHFARVALRIRWLEIVGAGKERNAGFVPRPLPVSGPLLSGRGRGHRARALAGPHSAAWLTPVPTPAPTPFRG